MFQRRHLVLAVTLIAGVSAVFAQDEAPDTFTQDEDGRTVHKASGAECPARLGQGRLVDVLSFDTDAERHLGVSCAYQFGLGTATLFIFKADEERLAGAGSSSERWNAAVRRTLAQFPNAIPYPLDGMGDDAETGLFGSVFEAGSAGGRVFFGLWFADGADWVVRGEAKFIPTEEGVAMARTLREAVISASQAAR